MSAAVHPPSVPALVVGSISHARHAPRRHSFDYAHYQWLVDLDDLPRLPRLLRPLGRFEARDHLDGGRAGGGIRGDLTRWLARRGVELEPDDRVLMLAHARAFGHVFDPLTVFWCLRPDCSVRAVVLEVHNTYGERHAYLLEGAEHGRTELTKEFYVSPFNDVSGRYAVAIRLTPELVQVVVALHREGQPWLTAVARGRPVPATTRNLLSIVRKHLFMTHRVSLLIRWEGLRLWRSRLPVQPRPPHSPEAVR
ncbi:DUF1365 domain-containing protein [Nocardioides insulae]|uniref:DUF1365 domain-containing protein n=1 Tax=Nocardioides insulae TaxID=394734 RepID=UPI0003F7EB1A|nr:DUF1365 domain-containing protein [Nocardioides insulae]